MDTDPLCETVPPRHAVESDDEDEFNPLSSSSLEQIHHDLNIKIIGSDSRAGQAIVASGDAGRVWARGAQLGAQIGVIAVNNKQVGMLFKPSWTDATVVVSEAATRLPVWAMHKYAEFVLEHLKPTRVVLLDTYSLPAYISSDYIPFHKAPMRYLAIPSTPPLSAGIQPFSPPNLIKSTSASFLSVVSVKSLSSALDIQAALFLLPSPQSPSRRPGEVVADMTRLVEETNIWPTELLQSAHSSVVKFIGGQASEWKYGVERASAVATASRSRVEGNMYI